MKAIIKFFGQSRIRSLLLFLFSILLVIALTTYSHVDPSFNLVTKSVPSNFLSYFGSYLADILYQFFGLSSFIIAICFFSWAYILYYEEKIQWWLVKFFCMLVAIAATCINLNHFTIEILPAKGGGVIGIILTQAISPHIILTNTTYNLITLFLAITFFIIALGLRFSAYLKIIVAVFSVLEIIGNKVKNWQWIRAKLNSFDDRKAYHPEAEFASIKSPVFTKKATPGQVNINHNSFIKKAPLVRNSAQQNKVINDEINVNYIPSIALLDDKDNQAVKLYSQADLVQKAEELLIVLNDFGVKGKIIDIRQGPVVTLYEFEPAAGTKSSRVIGLSDDIARSLSAISARIAVIPGRNALGIELPNKQRMFFRLKELIKTEEFRNPNILLPLILGKNLGGKPLIADLSKMPHLLVAGTTGSGKSVAINAMIMSLLYRYKPDECKMIMIDPKMLELSAYDNIPHLMTPVVTEPGKAVVALKWAVKEMENRYRLMSHLGVRNIANFNAKIQDTAAAGKILERTIQTGFDPETGNPIHETVPIDTNKMPFIVVIVDEMADLMIIAGKDIESSIQRLAQMARAAGIHIIMATQRPSVDVITGVIKANFPSRISFKVTSKIDSRTILGEQGAEQLLGMGDMLYMGNTSRILRVHGPFVDDKEVQRVTDFLRTTGKPHYISAVTESSDDEINPEFNVSDSDDNELYKQAVNIVRNERKASISYIQRSLRIGYNRAANIVEEMEKNGILSEPNISGKREILLPEN